MATEVNTLAAQQFCHQFHAEFIVCVRSTSKTDCPTGFVFDVDGLRDFENVWPGSIGLGERSDQPLD